MTTLVSGRPRAKALRFLCAQLERQVWRVGEQIPTEVELATSLGVSRTTVRSALKALEAKGLVQATRGSGRVVCRSVEEETGGSLMSNTVAFLRDPGQVQMVMNNAAVEQGVIDAFNYSDVHVLAINESSLDDEAVARLTAQQPYGVVATHVVGEREHGVSVLGRLADAGVPVVAKGDSPGLQRFDRVVSDHEVGGYELTRWFLGQGYKRIAQMTQRTADRYWKRARRRGYEKAMHEAGLDPLPYVWVGEHLLVGEVTEAAYRKMVKRVAGWLVQSLIGPEPLEVILLDTDFHHFYVAGAVRQCGLEPGKDVVTGGYDNYWRECLPRKWEPSTPAATVDRGQYHVGREMVRILEARHAGQLPDEPQMVLRPPQLIVTAQEDDTGHVVMKS